MSFHDNHVQDRASVAPSPTLNEDDRELEALGYVPSFKREFSNLATVRVSCRASISEY
jgi:hypothetical protein